MNQLSFTSASRLIAIAFATSVSACGGGSESPTASVAVAATPAASAASAAAPAASAVVVVIRPNLTLLDASDRTARTVVPGERDVELIAFRAIGDSSAEQHVSQIVAAMPDGASMLTNFRLIDSEGAVLGDANSYGRSSADGQGDQIITDFWRSPGWTDQTKLYRLVADASQTAPHGVSSVARIDKGKGLGGLSMHAFGATHSATITGGKVSVVSAEFAANYKAPMVNSDSLMYLPYVQAGTWLYYSINVSCDSQAAGGCYIYNATFNSYNLVTNSGVDQRGRRLQYIGGFVPAGTTMQFGFWAMGGQRRSCVTAYRGHLELGWWPQPQCQRCARQLPDHRRHRLQGLNRRATQV